MKLRFIFFLTLLTTALLSTLLPIRLFFPFLSLCALRLTYVKALWASVFIGLFIDLFSIESALGGHALCFALAMLVFFPYRIYVSEEKAIAFILYGFMFSSFITLFLSLKKTVLSGGMHWNVRFILSDFMLLPLLDAFIFYLLCIFPRYTLKYLRFLLPRRTP